MRLNPNNINKDSRIEIPEVWMPTIKKPNNIRATRQPTLNETTCENSDDINVPITAVENQSITADDCPLQK